MFRDFDETTVGMTAECCSFDLARPQMLTIYEQVKKLPERMQTYGFLLLEPKAKSILIFPASFFGNIIPKEYVEQFFNTEIGYQNNSFLNGISFLHRKGTAYFGKKWGEYAIYLGGCTYHGKLLIAGKQQDKGYKALSFTEIIEIILSLDLIAGYQQIEFHLLSPTSYSN